LPEGKYLSDARKGSRLENEESSLLSPGNQSVSYIEQQIPLAKVV
jgi:hypothetical protein